MLFEQLNLSPAILKALTEEGYQKPTPIQEQAIPIVMAGGDLLGCAQTGTGKTAAFALPILHRLAEKAKTDKPGSRPIRCLILTPTRELAVQIDESFASYGRHLPLRHTVVFGGVSAVTQAKNIRYGVDVLTATPGRLLDLCNQGVIDLSQVEHFILDEADRMLDMGFLPDVRRVIALIPKERQTLLFSATMPDEIAGLADRILRNPQKVAVTPVSSTVDKITQSLCLVGKKQKRDLLHHLLADDAISSVLIFTRTKHGADKVVKDLVRDGHQADAIHGNKSQNARQFALKRFKTGVSRILVATDIAARGIDIDELSHVINYELPDEPESYVHRIGRTGRAGLSGTAISFCDGEERSKLRQIHKLIGRKIDVMNHPFEDSYTEEETEKPLPQSNRGGRQMAGSRGGRPDGRMDARPRAFERPATGLSDRPVKVQGSEDGYRGDRGPRTAARPGGDRGPRDGVVRSGGDRGPRDGVRSGSDRGPRDGVVRSGSDRNPRDGVRSGNDRGPRDGVRSGSDRGPRDGVRSGSDRGPRDGASRPAEIARVREQYRGPANSSQRGFVERRPDTAESSTRSNGGKTYSSDRPHASGSAASSSDRSSDGVGRKVFGFFKKK